MAGTRVRQLEARGLLRFCAVGASNAVVSYTLFWVGIERLALSAAAAQAIGYSAGILWSYAWNRTWTFGYRGTVGQSLAAFTLVQLVALASSVAAIGLAVDGLSLPATPTWLTVMAVVPILNFLALRRWVFRPTGPAQSLPPASS